MVAERLRVELAGSPGEPMTIVQPGGGIDETVGLCTLGAPLGTHEGVKAREHFIAIRARRRAFPRAGLQRRETLFVREWLLRPHEQGRQVGGRGIPHLVAQRQGGWTRSHYVYDDHVRLPYFGT